MCKAHLILEVPRVTSFDNPVKIESIREETEEKQSLSSLFHS